MPNGVAAGQHGAAPLCAIAGFNSREINPKTHRFVEIVMRDCIIIVLAYQLQEFYRFPQQNGGARADNDPPTTIRCFVSPRLFPDGYPCLYIDVSAV
jgi:hypothetical protein